jgi:uncharacterized caspase-like protein
MPIIRKLFAVAVALLAAAATSGVARAEKRIALVVGNAGYQAGALTTPANDAGLVAQTLQAAGFDVVGARDLDQDSLRHAFRDFVEKATSSGPDTVAFVYLSGYGLQLEGENYFVPIDAKIARDSDVAVEALRISDYTRPLAAMKLKAGIIVIDGARVHPFAKSGSPLASGLALMDPEPGLLVAFNAAPGTVAPEGDGPYGPYAQALAEMLREGGLPLTGVFERTRLRVNDLTRGAEVPWQATKVQAAVVFFERAADAPPPAVSPEQTASIRARPLRDLDAQEAYILALERDTLDSYAEFVDAYPQDPMARRVRVIIAARREAITWRRSRVADTPQAYWSYLRRYPEGPHAADAHRRLAYLAAAFEPPSAFTALAYDVPPPPPEEIVFIGRPVLVFNDPFFAFAPPPPPPVLFLAPPPPEFVVLAPPPPPVGFFVLPVPIYRPVPVWVRPPTYVAPPPANNIIYTNVHNTVVVNNVTNTVTVTNRAGQTTTVQPPVQAAAPAGGAGRGAPGAAAPVAAIGPALPPSVAQKAVTLQNQTPQGTTPAGAPASGATTTTATPTPTRPGHPLPGMQGRPLPPAQGGTTPSAAVTPGGIGSTKPGTTPGATSTTPAAPSAAVTPGTKTPPSKPGTSATLPSGAKPLLPPQTPSSTTVTPPPGATTVTPPPGAPGSPSTPPGKHTAVPPAGSVKPVTPPPAKVPPPPAAVKPPPPAAAVKPPPPPPPAAIRPPPPPPAAVRPPPPPPPPAAVVRPVAPPPPPPPPRPAAPAPAAAVAKPAPPPAPKGCPPGKTAAVVNGQPTCK